MRLPRNGWQLYCAERLHDGLAVQVLAGALEMKADADARLQALLAALNRFEIHRRLTRFKRTGVHRSVRMESSLAIKAPPALLRVKPEHRPSRGAQPLAAAQEENLVEDLQGLLVGQCHAPLDGGVHVLPPGRQAIVHIAAWSKYQAFFSPDVVTTSSSVVATVLEALSHDGSAIHQW